MNIIRVVCEAQAIQLKFTNPFPETLPSMNFVKPAFEEFCLPTKKFADVIIPRGADNLVAIDLIVHHIWDIMYKKRPTPEKALTNGTCNGTHEEEGTNGRRMSGSSEDTLSR